MIGNVCSSSKSLKTELVGMTSSSSVRSAGNVPLAVAELVDQLVFGFAGRDMEGLVECAVRALYAEVGVEHQKRLANSIDDILRVRLDVFDERLLIHWHLACPCNVPDASSTDLSVRT